MSSNPPTERDKYLMRFDGEGVRASVQAAAAAEHMPMNTWLNLAIDEKLARGKRLDYLMDLAEKALKKAASK